MLEEEFALFLSNIENIILDKESINAIKKEYLSDKYKNTITKLADEVLKTLKDNSIKSIRENKLQTNEFLSRLEFRWYTAFDLFDLFVNCSIEIIKDINTKENIILLESDTCSDMLFRLHAKAIRISKEIQALITNGYADGAMGRWRSLFEICAIGLIINKYGSDLAKRYMEFMNIESYYEMIEFQKYCTALGIEKLSEEEVKRITTKKQELEKQYGKDYSKPYGWLNKVFPTGNRDLSRIIQDVELDLYRPYYKMACNSVHSGPKSLYINLGKLDSKPIYLIGPSNIGFTDPAQNTCISLYQITEILVMRNPTYTRYILLMSLNKLVNEVGITFSTIDQMIELEEKQKV